MVKAHIYIYIYMEDKKHELIWWMYTSSKRMLSKITSHIPNILFMSQIPRDKNTKLCFPGPYGFLVLSFHLFNHMLCYVRRSVAPRGTVPMETTLNLINLFKDDHLNNFIFVYKNISIYIHYNHNYKFIFKKRRVNE